MLGIHPQLRPDHSRFQMEPGDSALLFTDGLYSVKINNGDHLYWEAVQSALSKLDREPSPSALVNQITTSAESDSFDDDLTALMIHRRR